MKTRTLILLVAFLLPIQTSWTTGDRLPVYGRNGMVASTSMIASEIGRDVLMQGGNAIDAAVATAFALAVTWPYAGNIGGGGFLVYMNKEGEVTTFDFREKAPLKATPKMFLDQEGNIRDNSNHDGLLAVGVPGTVAGLFQAHQKYGSLAWRDLVEPSVKLASEGFPLPWSIYDHYDSYLQDKVEEYPSTAEVIHRPDGSRYQPGEVWPQKDLAQTLARIRDKGRDGFYGGETARKLSQFMAENGGLITEKDLREYEAVERVPVKGSYRGYDVYSMPPPSSGGVALIQMLAILEGFNLDSIGFQSAQYLHLLAETMRRAFKDRAQHIGDPDFNPEMPVAELLSPDHADELRAQIDMKRASRSDLQSLETPENENTTHFSVYDPQGNAVSMTFTLEQQYGTGIVAEGLGFFLNNQMGDFNPVPGETTESGQIGTLPNQVKPGKRMISSMTPTIVAQDGKPVLVIGSPGGRTIINTVLQITLNVIDHQMNIAQAIEAGRIHHQWFPDKLFYEKWAFSPDTRGILQQMGHTLEPRKRGQGRAMGIFIDHESGVISGASDTRSRDGGVAAF